MPKLRFSAVIKIIGISPYVFVSTARANPAATCPTSGKPIILKFTNSIELVNL